MKHKKWICERTGHKKHGVMAPPIGREVQSREYSEAQALDSSVFSLLLSPINAC